MFAIITRPNSDGSYDGVGMNNRIATSRYKTIRGLIKYGIPDHFKGKIRIECFAAPFNEKPFYTNYIIK